MTRAEQLERLTEEERQELQEAADVSTSLSRELEGLLAGSATPRTPADFASGVEQCLDALDELRYGLESSLRKLIKGRGA